MGLYLSSFRLGNTSEGLKQLLGGKENLENPKTLGGTQGRLQKSGELEKWIIADLKKLGI